MGVAYGLSVSVYSLSVTIFPNSRTQLVKVTDWPVNFTGLSARLTDRPVKVTDCTLTLPTQSVSHVQSGSPYLGQARYLLRQACLINRQAGKCNRQAVKLTDRLVARGLKLGSDTRVGNGPRQAGNLQPTLTDHVNIGPDSPKMHG